MHIINLSICLPVVKQSCTLLDHIYTNIPQCYVTGESDVLFNDISDHYPIFTVRYNIIQSNLLNYRNKNNFGEQNIMKMFKNKDWSHLYNLEQTQPAFSYVVLIKQFENT